MRIVIFGLTVSSSWGNGHATLWRGLWRALARRGHDIVFFERVYDVGALGEKFDLVLFMGLVYHLRHPLLALDLIHAHVAKDLMVYQSLQRGSPETEPLQDDYDFWQTDVFDRPGYPRLHFVENKYSHDETNWWLPNAACSAAMLRCSGFRVIAHPEEEVFLCKRVDLPQGPDGPRAVYPAGKDRGKR